MKKKPHVWGKFASYVSNTWALFPKSGCIVAAITGKIVNVTLRTVGNVNAKRHTAD
jgi:hypothetical protein